MSRSFVQETNDARIKKKKRNARREILSYKGKQPTRRKRPTKATKIVTKKVKEKMWKLTQQRLKRQPRKL